MEINNLILIEGGTFDQIKKALTNWIEDHSPDLLTGLSFELFKNEDSGFAIRVDEKLESESFFYLINYLKYPVGINYEAEVKGYIVGTGDNLMKDKQLQVYNPPLEKGYENVFMVTPENETFKINLNGQISQEELIEVYQLPDNLSLVSLERFIVENQDKQNKKTETIFNAPEKRFFIMSASVLVAILFSLMFFKSIESFLSFNFIIGFCLWGWLANDYKMLQADKLYFGSLAFALLFFIYGYFIYHYYFPETKASMSLFSNSLPMIFLIFQRPLRLLFIRIYKREPVIKSNSSSFGDFGYVFILFMSSILITAFWLVDILEQTL